MTLTNSETKLTDFRNATIKQHWNDPPHKVDEHEKLDAAQTRIILKTILEDCKQNVKSSDKRIISDTEKRLELLFEVLEKGQLSESVLGRLCKMCEYAEANDFANALAIHSNLMTTDFDKEGKWLLGIRRLLDLYRKKSNEK
ncbi:4833_t:CDS:2 [Acaulospora colombiana]|uniref:4833_t:CDS:1 n=1 Tax=Acaulospora colombiana TaxID=27376 RepID=A0ACA9KK49_9GLOM|nr:4833_t:CDS:2 [Acaulospora colombiana]